MTTYTCTFAFSGKYVLLIRKAKPDWQKGLYNGIGGKVEPGETIEQATIREFKEETGLWAVHLRPKIFHAMLWPEYQTHTDNPLVYFSGLELPYDSFKEAMQNTSSSDEPCVIWDLAKIAANKEQMMGNLPFLITMGEYMVCCSPSERKLRQPVVFDSFLMRQAFAHSRIVGGDLSK